MDAPLVLGLHFAISAAVALLAAATHVGRRLASLAAVEPTPDRISAERQLFLLAQRLFPNSGSPVRH
jgi:hypothetical protein